VPRAGHRGRGRCRCWPGTGGSAGRLPAGAPRRGSRRPPLPASREGSWPTGEPPRTGYLAEGDAADVSVIRTGSPLGRSEGSL